MLKWRIIIGAILAPAVLAMVWLLPEGIVAGAFACLALVVTFEWGGLLGLSGASRVTHVVATAVALAGSAWLIIADHLPLTGVVVAAAAVWLIPLAQLVLRGWDWRIRLRPAWASLLAVLLVVASWLSLAAPLLLGDREAYWLTALFIMVWGSDIGGYFAGRASGRRPLAPSISPSKTWEGCLGGILLALALTAALIGGLAGLGAFAGAVPWHHLMLVPPVVAAAIAGDLFESLLKRDAGVKDSGRILAGHGGALDRLDALLMAAPVYALLSVGIL
jgi:phosphatidate cytidylyltransferase